MVIAGDFGEMEDMVLGDAGGAAPIDRQGIGVVGIVFRGSEALEMGAGRIEFCTAISDDMFFHRQKETIGHQQAGLAGW